MLSEDTAIISAEGSGPAYRDKVIHDVLAEAARLTTANGYRYFVVLTADDLTHTVTVRYPRPGLAQPAAENERSVRRLLPAVPTPRAARATCSPIESRNASSPAMDIIIRMYRPGEIEPAEGVWDATAAIGPLTAN